MKLLGTLNQYNLIVVGSDIGISDAKRLLKNIRAEQCRRPVITMHALICSDHPKPQCRYSLEKGHVQDCEAVNAMENIVVMTHAQTSTSLRQEYSERLRMIAEFYVTKVDSLIFQIKQLGGSFDCLDLDGLGLLYFDLLLVKDLNSIILLNAHEANIAC